MDSGIQRRLRTLTEQALQEAIERDRSKDAEILGEANEIIDDILPNAEVEARAGRDFYVVMEVTYRGKPELFERKPLALSAELLTGASRIVYEFCEKEGLNPTLVGRWTQLRESFHRIDFSLVIHW